MKKKKPYAIVAMILLAVAVFAVAAYFLIIRKGGGPRAVPLDEFSTDGEYRFGKLEWGTSFQDVKKALPYKLTEIRLGDNDVGYIRYDAEIPFELGGCSGTASFEFQGDRLNLVQFVFYPEGDHEGWFDEQVGRLAELYGEADDEMENSSERFSSRGYRWLTEETTLQAILTTDVSKPFVQIGIAELP